MGEGFKAHGAGLGPKLGAGLAAGPTGLQRRVEAARSRERARELARRGQAASPEAGLGYRAEMGRSGDEQGTSGETAGVKPSAAPSTGKKRPRGRPKVEGLRPWEFEGVSRRTWERRRKAGGG